MQLRTLSILLALLVVIASCNSSSEFAGCENVQGDFAEYLQITEQAIRSLDTSSLAAVTTGDELERLQIYIENFTKTDVIPYVEYKELTAIIKDCSENIALADASFKYRTNTYHRSSEEIHYDTEWHNRFATVHFEKQDGQWKVFMLEFNN